MTGRNMFDWQPPEGTTIDQSFTDSYTLQNGQDQRDVRFTARCRCGAVSSVRASRADALEELDGHVCGEEVWLRRHVAATRRSTRQLPSADAGSSSSTRPSTAVRDQRRIGANQ